MKSLLALLLLLAVGATSSVTASAASSDVDDAAVAESSKAFSLLLPAVALPYAIALVAIVVPLAKAFVAHALKLMNLPFEGMVALYLVLYAALFTFPQLASLLTATSVFTARSAAGEPAPAAAGHQFPMGGTVLDWVRNFVPHSWADAMSAAVPALKKSPTTTTYTTLPDETTTATVIETAPAVATAETTSVSTTTPTPPTTATKGSSTTQALKSSTLIAEDVVSPAVQEHRVVLPEVAGSSAKCSSFKVCESVSRLVKDYPVSAMLMSYLGDYLQGLKYERPVREGMAGLDCSAIYSDCR